MAHLKSIKTIRWSDPTNLVKLGHNTYAWRNRDGNYAIRYYSTWVVQFHHATVDDSYDYLVVNTNGWFSKTTAERIHHGLDGQFGLNFYLSTTDLPGRWRVMDNKGNAFTIRGNQLILRRHVSSCGVSEWQRYV
jgi:hypothetical protein